MSFPWESGAQPTRARAAPFGHENVGNVQAVSFVDILGGDVKHIQANDCSSLKAQVEERRKAKEEHKRAQLEADRKDDARVERESAFFAADAQAEVQAQRDREALVARREAMGMARYQQGEGREQQVETYQQQLEDAHPAAPQHAHQMVAGGRMPTRNEHTGISDHPSTRVHAAPGGHSSLSLSDGSAPESQQRAASRPAPPPPQPQQQQQQQQQVAPAPHYAAADQHAAEQRAAAIAIRERARGGFGK